MNFLLLTGVLSHCPYNFMISKWHPEMQHLHPQKTTSSCPIQKPIYISSRSTTTIHTFLHLIFPSLLTVLSSPSFFVPAFGPKSCLIKKCAKSMPAATPCRKEKHFHMQFLPPLPREKNRSEAYKIGGTPTVSQDDCFENTPSPLHK